MATFGTVRAKLSDALAEANAASEPTVAVKTQAAIDECDAATGGSPGPPSAIRYRSDQPYLFQHVRAAREPDRIHQGDSGDWIQDGAGTQGQVRVQPVGGPSNVADHIDFFIGWAWDSKGKGGDIIDRNLARNPSTPTHWLTLPINAVTSGARQYSIDATPALKFIQENGRWNAWSFNKTAPTARAMAGKASATPPRFDVTYTDGQTVSLACRITAMMSGSTAYPYTLLNQSLLPQFELPLVAEFEKPTKPVQSAMLVFTIATHTSMANTFTGNVLDPPLNTDPVQLGVAQQAGILDAGIMAAPGIINAHQYLDSLPDSEWFDWSGPQNTDDEKNFSPEMIWPEHTGNPVPPPYLPDLTKYPHRSSPVGGKHKWIGMAAAQAAQQFFRVPSTYAHEGFEPLAPGVGALRVCIPPVPGIRDGFIEQSSAWQTVLARIWMPPDLWGVPELFTRYYLRLGTPTRLGTDPLGVPDIPYRMPIAERYQVFNSSGHWIFTDCHGKFGINPEQVTGYGGFSGTAGGGGGNQFRNLFGDISSADHGPDVGGVSLGCHLYDEGARNPPGFQYNGDGGNLTSFGQRGGLGGIIYGNQWYCLEGRIKVNDVRDAQGNIIPPLPANNMRGGYLPNGEIQYWLDGRCVFLRTGMVFRSAPYAYWKAGNTYDTRNLIDPGYNKALRRQCHDLGFIAQMLNFYHGGVTQNNVWRTWFISQLVYGTQYVGPSRLA